jgi:hypothetical protein
MKRRELLKTLGAGSLVIAAPLGNLSVASDVPAEWRKKVSTKLNLTGREILVAWTLLDMVKSLDLTSPMQWEVGAIIVAPFMETYQNAALPAAKQLAMHIPREARYPSWAKNCVFMLMEVGQIPRRAAPRRFDYAFHANRKKRVWCSLND